MTERPDDTEQKSGPELAELKREGCALLVTGDDPASVHADACRQFLGDGDGIRKVLAVSCDGFGAVSEPGLDARVIQYRGSVRSASAETGASTSPEPATEDLEGLGIAILDEIEAYEEATPEPTPGGLRVALASAAPLVAEYGREQVFAFLHLLTERVREADGMVFVHLPVESDTEVAATLRPLFDGTIELRVADGRCQQRWHLDDATSGWLDC